MKDYFRQRWKKYWTSKTWFGKISDLIFILLVIGMLIPASRKEISAFMARLMASSPKEMKQNQQQKIPEEAWNWSVTDIEGRFVSLHEFKNKAIFLNFWATWCPPCIAEMPDIQELYDQFGQDVAFLLITDEDIQKVTAFMQKRGFEMPVYFHRGAVPEIFATNSIPTTWIIDPDGNITIRKTGAAKWNSKSMQQTMQEYISRYD